MDDAVQEQDDFDFETGGEGEESITEHENDIFDVPNIQGTILLHEYVEDHYMASSGHGHLLIQCGHLLIHISLK